MQELRAGRVLRLVRRRRGWTQSDLAALSGVSQQTVSLLERGNADAATLRLIKQVAAPLGIMVDLVFRWKGPELDRLMDARHARIVKALVGRLGPAWEVIVEYSFNHFGERGTVDVLAWHSAASILVIFEVKSELDGLESVLRPIDVKARVVPSVLARERGWAAASVGVVLVLPDDPTTRRAVESAAFVLDIALPGRTVAVRRWLEAPAGSLRGLWFLSDTATRRVVRNAGSGGRVVNSRRGVRHAQARPADASNEASEGVKGVESASNTPTRRK